MQHGPFQRHTVVTGLRASGGSLRLPKCTLAIVDASIKKATKSGLAVATDFNRKSLYKIKVGTSAVKTGSNGKYPRGATDKAYQSTTFGLSDVKMIQFFTPRKAEDSVDEVHIGYDGIDPNSSLTFAKGENRELTVSLTGGLIKKYYGTNHFQFSVPFNLEDCPGFEDVCKKCNPCDPVPCGPVVQAAVRAVQDTTVIGNTPLTDFIDIRPIRVCDDTPKLDEVDFDYWCLKVCDTGDDLALSEVATQYPEYFIRRKGRVGAISEYEFLTEGGATIADYELKASMVVKGCAPCEAGTTEVPGGVVYSVIVPGVVDITAAVAGLPGADAASVSILAQGGNSITYSVVTDDELTDAEIAAFVATNAQAEVCLQGSTSAFCDDPTISTIAWEKCGTCQATTECYLITLPDVECDGLQGRLEDLQKFYAGFTVTETGITGLCNRQYKIVVPTNMRCPECDPALLDIYKSEKPSPFDSVQWEKDETIALEGVENCKCGIVIKGKVLEVCPDSCDVYDISYEYDSTRIQVSGGYAVETSLNAGVGADDSPYKVTYRTRYQPIVGMGGDLRGKLNQGIVYNTGIVGNGMNRFKDNLLGTELCLEDCEQYEFVKIRLQNTRFAQNFSDLDTTFTDYLYHFKAGTGEAIKAIFSKLGAAAGIVPEIVA